MPLIDEIRAQVQQFTPIAIWALKEKIRMPQVHEVKSARKAQPHSDIKKGDSYFWWKFRHGGKRTSKTPPKRSQLTQSEFYSQLYGLQDDRDAVASNVQIDFDATEYDFDATKTELEDLASTLRDIGSECEEKKSNLEEHFTGGSPTIDLLEERAEWCESQAGELESVDTPEVEEIDRGDYDKGDDGDEEYESAKHDALESAVEEFRGAIEDVDLDSPN